MLNTELTNLQNLVSGINANQGTVNCAYCALRFDEHLAAGKNLNLGPVSTESANMLSHPLFKAGKIKRSTTKDKRLIARASLATTDYREICSVDDPTPLYEIDLTTQTPSEELRFISANQDNIETFLQMLPRRKKDGSAYGFILLTHDKHLEIGHIINFYVDMHDQVYFIDAQKKNACDQITRQLNMKGYRSEIFYLQSIPPEGFKPIIKKESNSNIKPEKERLKMLNSMNIKVVSPFKVHPDQAQENFNNLLKVTSDRSATPEHWYWLEYCYFNGIGTNVDHDKAFNCIKKGLEVYPQSSYLWNALGHYYFNNDTLEKRNIDEGYKSYLKANIADNKNEVAWFNLGVCYKMGAGTKVNPQEAFRCFKKAADLGGENINLWKFLSECYEKGIGTDVDLKEFTRCKENFVKFENQKKAKEFDRVLTRTKSLCATAEDFGDIGDRYTTGYGTQKNEEEGFRCYKKATELNNKYGKVWNNLGICYKNGRGTPSNLFEAFRCFKKSTECNGGAAAWYNLYLCYEKGFGTSINHEEAVKCAKKAAELDKQFLPLVNLLTKFNSPLLFSTNNLPSQTVNPAPSPVSVLPSPAITPVNDTTTPQETQLKLKDEEIKLLREQLALKEKELVLKERQYTLLLEELSNHKRMHEEKQNASKKQKLG